MTCDAKLNKLADTVQRENGAGVSYTLDIPPSPISPGVFLLKAEGHTNPDVGAAFDAPDAECSQPGLIENVFAAGLDKSDVARFAGDSVDMHEQTGLSFRISLAFCPGLQDRRNEERNLKLSPVAHPALRVRLGSHLHFTRFDSNHPDLLEQLVCQPCVTTEDPTPILPLARILRSHDLPFPGAFEPRVGPDQTTLCLLSIFILGDRAFRSIRYGDGVAEKSHLHFAQLAVT